MSGYEPLPIRLRGENEREFWSAESHARVAANLVAASGMAPVVKARIERLSVGEHSASVLDVRTMLNSSISVSPVGVNTNFTVSVPTGGSDAYGKPGGFRVNGAQFTVEGSTTRSPAVRITGNRILVSPLNGLAAADIVGTLVIW